MHLQLHRLYRNFPIPVPFHNGIGSILELSSNQFLMRLLFYKTSAWGFIVILPGLIALLTKANLWSCLLCCKMQLILNPATRNSTNQPTYCSPLTSYEIYLMVKTLDWSDLPLTTAVAPFGQNDTGPNDHLIRVIFLIKTIHPNNHFDFWKQMFTARSKLSYTWPWITGSGFGTRSKNFKTPFFQDIKNSFHGVTRMGLEPHQNFIQNFFHQIWSLEEFKVFAY